MPKLGYFDGRVPKVSSRVTLATSGAGVVCHMYRGVESFTISTINFSIHNSNKIFFNILYEDSRAESSIYVFKIILQRLFSVNMFIWIDNGEYVTTINKKFIRFFFSRITRMILRFADFY